MAAVEAPWTSIVGDMMPGVVSTLIHFALVRTGPFLAYRVFGSLNVILSSILQLYGGGVVLDEAAFTIVLDTLSVIVDGECPMGLDHAHC